MYRYNEVYNNRTQEINKYLKTLLLIDEEGLLYYPHKRVKIKRIDVDMIQVFKATVLLMLSTVVLALKEIYINITNHQPTLQYKDLIDCLQKLRLQITYKNFKDFNKEKHNSREIYQIIKDIGEQIITLEFTEETLKGWWNIDSRKIREIWEKYWFSTRTHHRTGDGSKLVIVKNRRNDLAHWNYSFAEVGRDYSINQLLEINKLTQLYLKKILSNISIYLDNKHYKV